jgi:hypothetical protein
LFHLTDTGEKLPFVNSVEDEWRAALASNFPEFDNRNF